MEHKFIDMQILSLHIIVSVVAVERSEKKSQDLSEFLHRLGASSN